VKITKLTTFIVPPRWVFAAASTAAARSICRDGSVAEW
jgi:hypothetical protein